MKLLVGLTEDRRPAVAVTLSRRNLLALLAKLDTDGSACTLLKREKLLGQEWVFAVVGEEDNEHYSNRIHPPGRMHQVTESFIRRTGNQDRN